MNKVLFITPPEARHGFTLAGVEQVAVPPAEAEAALQRALADPATAVTVIDERLLAGIPEERLQGLEKRGYGVLVVLPAPSAGEEPAEDYAVRLIRRAIGYHVRMHG